MNMLLALTREGFIKMLIINGTELPKGNFLVDPVLNFM